MKRQCGPEWMARGACVGRDPEPFFPGPRRSAAAARRICRLCPVRAQCLDYALVHNEQYGVWGGTTPRQRLRILRVRTNPHPTSSWGREVKIVNPNATLTEMRTLARLLYEHWDGIRTLPIDELEGKSYRLASLINAIDEWLCDGHALPDDWSSR